VAQAGSARQQSIANPRFRDGEPLFPWQNFGMVG
jgi:hypothetical protein